MSDLIPTRDRIMALLSPPSQDVWLTVDDARWIKAEIERLRAVVDAAQRLYSGGLYPENHEYILIFDRSLDALEEALDKLQEVGDE
jgi:hypothetical protein